MTERLKAPFPYYGGKSRVAAAVWDRLGDVDNYIEPFAGSAALLLARPHTPRIETINDAFHHVANFWRATQRDPDAVATFADGPVNEADLHARHRYLVLSDEAKAFRASIESDPDYFNAKFAGWWCWGQCCWIGGGWCAGPDHRRRPHLTGKKGCGGQGVNRVKATTCSTRRAWLLEWFGRLRDRLRVVRVCCGDWSRVCDSESVTTRLGLTGVFFDPPYSAEAGRATRLYAVESATVAHDVRAYCLAHGSDPRMRLALAGYDGEGHEELEAAGWRSLAWRDDKPERIWFSPHCLGEGHAAEGGQGLRVKFESMRHGPKRAAVEAILDDADTARRSTAWIARQAGVSWCFVSKLRTLRGAPTEVLGADGKTYKATLGA